MNIHSILKSALCAVFVFIGSAHSATITVDGTNGAVVVDGVCTISEAIIAANTDAVVSMAAGECIAGNGTDTINLSTNIILTAAFEESATYGSTGTPVITSPIILDGMDFTILRTHTIFNCTIDNTNAANEFRLIRISTNGDLTLNNITLSNGCANGGGLANPGGAVLNQGILSIDNSTISGNSVFSFGGGVRNFGTIPFIINTSFSDNSAGEQGGGIYNSDTITTIQNSTFSGNSAIAGGGIYNDSTITTIENSTFSANTADFRGGGINNTSTITTIQNSTFSGNTAVNNGAAIRNFNGTISTLRNSLFHQNTGGGSECSNNGGSINDSNNLSDNTSSDCPNVSTTLTTATVGPLADNGGPTMTHALLPDSEAIDASGVGATTTDQRGFITSTTRDIGAFEAFVPVIVAPADVSVEATGPLTSPALGNASVSDVDETGLVAIANPADNFALGLTTVTWTVTDSQGFVDTDTQVVTIVDTTGPTITLSGDATVILSIGDSYVDAGATAEDLVDGTISNASINVVNPVNTALAGNYTITYDVQDNAGNNAAQVTRLVKVQASIGGTISGLVNSNTVTISDGNQSFELGNTSYTFSTHLDTGSNYSVSMTDSPTSQICQISNNTGTITDSNISNINVICGPLIYFIGGMASGLEIGNPVILELNTELLTVSDNAAFVFLTPLEDGENYTVNIDTLPARHDCDLVNLTGMIATNDISDVEVNCTIMDNVFSDSFED